MIEFIAKENEEVCSVSFETKEKDYLFVEKKCFFFDTIETNGQNIKHETSIGSNDPLLLDLSFLLTWRKYGFYMLFQKYVPYKLMKTEEMEKSRCV